MVPPNISGQLEFSIPAVFFVSKALTFKVSAGSLVSGERVQTLRRGCISEKVKPLAHYAYFGSS